MRAAFLQAIRDDPADDTPRLVFADWLEEQNEGDRAELIRIQCELTRGTRDRGRSVELLRRLRELVIQYRTTWLGLLAVHAPDSVFERGFVEQVHIRAEPLLQHADLVFAQHPITRLRTWRAWDSMANLATCRHVAGLTHLDLHEDPVTDTGATYLASSTHLERLRHLDLTRTALRVDGLRALVSSAGLAGLETLLVGYNALGDAGVEVLTACLNLPRLTRLDLSANEITDRGGEWLARTRSLQSLRSLRLSSNRLRSATIEQLARSPHLSNLQVLDVSGNGISVDVARSLHREFGWRVVC